MQRGAALGGHGDPAVPVTAQESTATAQVHQDRITVGPGSNGLLNQCRRYCY